MAVPYDLISQLGLPPIVAQSLNNRAPSMRSSLSSLGLPAEVLNNLRRAGVSDEYTPEEESSALGRLGEASLSGIATVGGFLDKYLGGRAVRAGVGLLTGNEDAHASELLSALPFSDALGLTDPGNAIGGRELLDPVLGENEAGLDWGDVAGFGVEVALDPSSWLTLGASGSLTAAGKAAKAAGLLDDLGRAAGKTGRLAKMTTTADDILRIAPDKADAFYDAVRAAGGDTATAGQEVLSGLAGFGMPFSGRSRAIGKGAAAQKIAGAMDAAGAAVKGSAPVRFGRMLFDHDVMGQYTPKAQEVAEMVSKGMPTADRAAMTNYVAKGDEMEAAFNQFAGVAESVVPKEELKGVFDRILRYSTEMGGNVDEAIDLISPGLKGQLPPELSGELVRLGDDMQKLNRQAYDELGRVGGNARLLEGDELLQGFEQFPRSVSAKSNKQYGAGRVMQTGFDNALSRTPETRGIPKEVVNRLIKDDLAREGGADYILNAYGRWLADGYQTLDASGAQAVGKAAQANDLAEWVARHSEDFVKNQADLYDVPIAGDLLKYQMGVNRATNMIKGVQELFRRNVDSNGVLLKDAFGGMKGMNPDSAVNYFAELMKVTPEEAAKMRIAPEAVNAAQALTKLSSSPEWAQKIATAVDTYTNMFKRGVTLPFPAFHGRNFGGGQFMNLASGDVKSPRDLLKYGNSVRRAMQLLRNPTKSRATIREMQANDVFGASILPQGLASSKAAPIIPGLADSVPLAPYDLKGMAQRGMAEASSQVGSTPSILDRLPGGQTARKVVGSVTETGSNMAESVEFMNRASMYLYLKGKGFSPEMASRRVKELQLNYNNLSPFEQTVMKRVMPFYSFTRLMGESVIRNLIDNPGGGIGQTIRATSLAGDPNAITPEYIAQTASIPLGRNEDGSDRYITNFGLPHEDIMQFAGGNVQDSLLEAGSRLNPLLKAPLEWATGESFFQTGPGGGRDLADLDPTVGRTISNLLGEEQPVSTPRSLEFALANSPVSRFMTTARTLSDRRKYDPLGAMNFLTGVRVSDISPEQRDREAITRLGEQLKEVGARTFSNVYVPEEVKEGLSQSELEMLGLLKSIGRRQGARRREAAKQ
jgi:hypothetical protein